MNTAVRALERREGRPVVVGSAVVTMAVMGLAIKVSAGMRGQTVGELVRRASTGRAAPRSSRTDLAA
jgi:hypothetical protein